MLQFFDHPEQKMLNYNQEKLILSHKLVLLQLQYHYLQLFQWLGFDHGHHHRHHQY